MIKRKKKAHCYLLSDRLLQYTYVPYKSAPTTVVVIGG